MKKSIQTYLGGALDIRPNVNVKKFPFWHKSLIFAYFSSRSQISQFLAKIRKF